MTSGADYSPHSPTLLHSVPEFSVLAADAFFTSGSCLVLVSYHIASKSSDLGSQIAPHVLLKISQDTL